MRLRRRGWDGDEQGSPAMARGEHPDLGDTLMDREKIVARGEICRVLISGTDGHDPERRTLVGQRTMVFE